MNTFGRRSSASSTPVAQLRLGVTPRWCSSGYTTPSGSASRADSTCSGVDVLVVARERLLRAPPRAPAATCIVSCCGSIVVILRAAPRRGRRGCARTSRSRRLGVRGRGQERAQHALVARSRRARPTRRIPALSTAVESWTRCAPSSSNRYRVTVATASRTRAPARGRPRRSDLDPELEDARRATPRRARRAPAPRRRAARRPRSRGSRPRRTVAPAARNRPRSVRPRSRSPAGRAHRHARRSRPSRNGRSDDVLALQPDHLRLGPSHGGRKTLRSGTIAEAPVARRRALRAARRLGGAAPRAPRCAGGARPSAPASR